MLLNEYRLNPARREDQEVIVKQMEQYFFGQGSAPPKEYVPPRSSPTESIGYGDNSLLFLSFRAEREICCFPVR